MNHRDGPLRKDDQMAEHDARVLFLIGQKLPVGFFHIKEQTTSSLQKVSAQRLPLLTRPSARQHQTEAVGF
ncbi:hypothetical protein EYF80_032569 [Liparis tanakae]|uniref:Uncharacterized protein n=1 Tax=Liparis tanakae TaxID=230148 RepID=A0A4Z2GVW3_9TELE|nr:hypothetical protein EYF80_032569 [Liparis tanakae]